MPRLGRDATGRPQSCGIERLEDRRLFSAGDLDPTFGTGGTTQLGRDAAGTLLNGSGEHGIDSRNGRTVVAINDAVVARFDSGGHYDATFGQGGKLRIADFVQIDAVAIQADNKVLVGGSVLNPSDPYTSRPGVVRLNANGTIDSGYGVGGFRTFPASILGSVSDIAIGADGKAVLTGVGDVGGGSGGNLPRFFATRLTTAGQLDTSFGGSGIVGAPISHTILAGGRAVAIQSDGSILVAGNVTLPADPTGGSAAVVRITAAGRPDAGFGAGGA
ncbi:MAG TPA: hypothetical protein VL371_22355, partial [Gemmataceae bacterium]|nr:hypothetical protein [Gemmataceae bacterium]